MNIDALYNRTYARIVRVETPNHTLVTADDLPPFEGMLIDAHGQAVTHVDAVLRARRARIASLGIPMWDDLAPAHLPLSFYHHVETKAEAIAVYNRSFTSFIHKVGQRPRHQKHLSALLVAAHLAASAGACDGKEWLPEENHYEPCLVHQFDCPKG